MSRRKHQGSAGEPLPRAGEISFTKGGAARATDSVAHDHTQAVASMRYRPEIDGLRCLAVMPVVLFHAGFGLFSGGFVGVDVFFVISGFLITELIIKENEQSRFSVVGFYERRVRRLLPALLAMIFTVFVMGQLVLLPAEMIALGRQILSVLLLSSNILFWHQASYFDADSITKPLLHTWSLSLEGQFYIVFPIFLWVMLKSGTRYMVYGCIFAFLCSISIAIFGAERFSTAVFYLLPGRLWEFVTGSIVALLPRYKGRLAECVSWMGLIASIIPIFVYSEAMTFPGFAALPSCLGTAAVLASAHGTSCARFLSLPVMRFLGLISYSLYLWHWPIIVYLGFELGMPLPIAAKIGACILSIVISYFSLRYIERPFRELRNVRLVWIFAISSIMIGVVLGFGAVLFKGFPQRYSSHALALTQQNELDRVYQVISYSCVTELLDVSIKQFGPCKIGSPTGGLSIVAIGDSHAMAMRPALSAAMSRHGIRGQLISVPGCPPVLGLHRVGYDIPCEERSHAIASFIRRTRPDGVILIGAWRGVLSNNNTVYEGLESHDNSSRINNVQASLVNTIRYYHYLGIQVAVVMPVPGAKTTAATAVARGSYAPLRYTTAEHRKIFRGFSESVYSSEADAVTDPADILCKNECAVTDFEGNPLYFDKTHLNRRGSFLIEPVIDKLLMRLYAARGQLISPKKNSVQEEPDLATVKQRCVHNVQQKPCGAKPHKVQ